MKLSKLIGYLNLLESETLNPDYVSAMKDYHALVHVIQHNPIQIREFTNNISKNMEDIDLAFSKLNNSIHDLKANLTQLIAEAEPHQLKESTRLYEQDMMFDTTETILNRKLAIDDESNIILRNRLKSYTDWRLPGMIIHPGYETFIEDLVPLDPLYLVAQNLEVLEPATAEFTEEYRRRLRLYEVNDYNYGQPLWQLPDNQFGLIFAYNYFNYRPVEVIHRYLTGMFDKLRPGGVAIFTFNDCDRAHGAGLSERNFMCYTPGRMLQAHVDSIGFDTLNIHHGLGDLTWMEIQKPGNIQSIRGGQSLAKIIANQ